MFILAFCMPFSVDIGIAQTGVGPVTPPTIRDIDPDNIPNSLNPPSQLRRIPDQFFRHDQLPDLRAQEDILSFSVIRKAVQNKYPGRIVNVQILVPNREGLNYLYDVRVLAESGKLLTVIVDAKSAQILDVKG